jgi:hypothetical protein
MFLFEQINTTERHRTTQVRTAHHNRYAMFGDHFREANLTETQEKKVLGNRQENSPIFPAERRVLGKQRVLSVNYIHFNTVTYCNHEGFQMNLQLPLTTQLGEMMVRPLLVEANSPHSFCCQVLPLLGR